ncbi:glycosyltransferase family 2 protein [Histidinibacterium aquaticum]|uniref:glycosyltransferase family 2 protein n=1 Tax=Histidinibacterium aquaticum TaxID=2613962 RepID=UPI00168AB601|nr:glycosyltransferase family A protein [Histidinibacterium aquaticum]
MPYQSYRFERMGSPFRSAHIAACAGFEVPPVPTSQRAPWLRTRFGFVGSAEGFDLLRFEAPTLALTPRIAPAVLAAGQIDLLVLECAQDDLTGEWGLSFLDWAGSQADGHDLMRRAEEAGIPRIALLRGDSCQVDLFAPLAAAADYAVVTSSAARKALARQGIAADLVEAAMQPALHHGFVPQQHDEAWEVPPVLSLDLVQAIDDPDVAALLDSLTPFGLGLCSADRVVRQHRVETLPQTLVGSSLGTVTPDHLRHLFGEANLLVQVARSDRAPGRDVQHALHAAASRCAVVILGEIPDDDPRSGFAQVFSELRELRLFVSRISMDPIFAEMHLQAAWRRVHRDHAAAEMTQQLAAYAASASASSTVGKARPRATVVTPTFRPDRLQEVLESFRAQTWPDRELIVVANTDDPARWDSALLRPEAGEQIVFLPRCFGPGTALNIGGARGSGDYVLRMDDDDHYGPHYVEDMMLGAAALNPDMMGKNACFYNYVDEGRLVYLPTLLEMPRIFTSDQISGGGRLAGFSHTVRRSLLRRLGGFPDGQHGGVDVAFLDKLIDERELLCASADALNAVVERRSDVRSHTWQTARSSDNVHFKEVQVSLQVLLEGIEGPPLQVTPVPGETPRN